MFEFHEGVAVNETVRYSKIVILERRETVLLRAAQVKYRTIILELPVFVKIQRRHGANNAADEQIMISDVNHFFLFKDDVCKGSVEDRRAENHYCKGF